MYDALKNNVESKGNAFEEMNALRARHVRLLFEAALARLYHDKTSEKMIDLTLLFADKINIYKQ